MKAWASVITYCMSEESLVQKSLSTVLLLCGVARMLKGVWIWQCIWKSALLWDSGFCRKQHFCGQTYSCHRDLTAAGSSCPGYSKVMCKLSQVQQLCSSAGWMEPRAGWAWLLARTDGIPRALVQTHVRNVFSHWTLDIGRGAIIAIKLFRMCGMKTAGSTAVIAPVA